MQIDRSQSKMEVQLVTKKLQEQTLNDTRPLYSPKQSSRCDTDELHERTDHSNRQLHHQLPVNAHDENTQLPTATDLSNHDAVNTHSFAHLDTYVHPHPTHTPNVWGVGVGMSNKKPFTLVNKPAVSTLTTSGAPPTMLGNNRDSKPQPHQPSHHSASSKTSPSVLHHRSVNHPQVTPPPLAATPTENVATPTQQIATPTDMVATPTELVATPTMIAATPDARLSQHGGNSLATMIVPATDSQSSSSDDELSVIGRSVASCSSRSCGSSSDHKRKWSDVSMGSCSSCGKPDVSGAMCSSCSPDTEVSQVFFPVATADPVEFSSDPPRDARRLYRHVSPQYFFYNSDSMTGQDSDESFDDMTMRPIKRYRRSVVTSEDSSSCESADRPSLDLEKMHRILQRDQMVSVFPHCD